MAQYYWEAQSGDVGSLPSNASVSVPWHPWDTLEVTSSSSHVDFAYGLRGTTTTAQSARRVAAFASIDGNTLTQSGVTEIYGVVATSHADVESGIGGRLSGGSSSETGLVSRAKSDGSDTQDTIEYDNASASILTSLTDTLSNAIVAFRMQFDGTTVRTRFWDYDTTEPGTWDATDTTTVTGDGDWGMFAFDMDTNGSWCELLALGFGNAGDAAPTSAPTGNVEVSAGSAGLTITPQNASVAYDVPVSAGVDTLSFTTYTTTIGVGYEIDADVASLTITPYNASVTYDIPVGASAGSLTITPYTADININVSVSSGVGSLTITPYNATVDYSVSGATVSADVASLAFTTYPATVVGSRVEPSREHAGVALNLGPPPRQVDDINSWQWKEWISTLHREVDKAIKSVIVDNNKNVQIGRASIATDATDGFLYIPSCAGTPTGTPTNKEGLVPLVYDSTNEKLYVYNGSWVSITLT